MASERQSDWQREWGETRWTVALRATDEDRGTTLRIGSRNGTEEWLRFDCFDSQPHWHLDPNGRNEIQPLGASGDAAAEISQLTRGDLATLLTRAGAPKAATASLDSPHENERSPAAEREAFLLGVDRALRHRPATLDELDPRQLEARRSEKWHTYPSDVLPAWVAEMDFPIAAPIQAELRRFSEQSDVGYPISLSSVGLREVFRDRMVERFGWNPDPTRVEILSEVVQGMYLCLEAFAEPGEGALVQTPIYPPFLHAVSDTNRRLVLNPLRPTNKAGEEAASATRAARLEIDFDGLEESIDASTRVFLFCNPHNPSGRVFSRTELERLAEVVLRHDLTVVSDEIHGDVLFDEREHIPFATLSPEIAERTVTLTSPSKAFNIPGLRCAIAHFGSEALQDRFNTVLPRHIRGGIGLIGLYSSIAAWRYAQPWLDEVRPYLEANRDFAEKAIADRIPEICFYRPQGTYLAWLDCTALDLPRAPATHFLREGRVALSNGKAFGEGWEQFVRLNFATSRPILTEVIDRMAKALGR